MSTIIQSAQPDKNHPTMYTISLLKREPRRKRAVAMYRQALRGAAGGRRGSGAPVDMRYIGLEALAEFRVLERLARRS